VYSPLSVINCTTPTTRPSSLTGTIIAAVVFDGPPSGILSSFPSASTL
jgi:hypothetical protein